LKNNIEKRLAERFSLELEGKVKVSGENGDSTLELMTRDICSGGAFFYTNQPMPVGIKVKVDVVLSVEQLKKMVGTKALLEVSGKVVRSEKQGMAVCFDKEYLLSSPLSMSS